MKTLVTVDFFRQQDIARRNTTLLLLLFIASVVLLIGLTNAAVAAFLFFSQDYNVYNGNQGDWNSFLSYFTWARFGGIASAITLTVALVILIKWIQLSSGGKAVAEAMGGERLLPQSRDRAERRCLNIVEEMALASNMPVPATYILNGERGINAFAAGITPADAVVAVTRGCVEHLSRDELQGVIAHEFSHILNGDMRLSIRLVALLKGITFIGDVGHMLLRSSNRVRTGRGNGKGGAIMPVLGLVLWLLGWIGGLVAGFIKAAISRQKEYLADASAVQYTRNPEGIADALKVIGGYLPGTLVHAARAAEMSHIFFGQIEHHLWQVFATHPPLDQRIRRLDPQWNGEYINRKVRHYAEQPRHAGSGEVGVGRAAIVAAAVAASLEEPASDSEADASFAEVDNQEERLANQVELPVAFVRYSHEPLGASALTLALLLDSDETIKAKQLDIIADTGVTGLADLTHSLAPGVQELGAPRRLPLLELCLPALKSISLRQYRQFKNTLLQVIHADQRTELHEWCLFQLLRHYLDPEFIQVRSSRARYRSLRKVRFHLRTVLSVLAYQGAGDAEPAFAAAASELGFGELTILPPAQCSVAGFSRAVTELADCYPLLKPQILKAMKTAAAADGEVCYREREIITSVAAVMDCPCGDL